MKNARIIQPGAVIGMLGDGQLGKMSSLAGAYLGYKFAILGPEGRNSPAGQVAWWAESWGEGYSNDGKIEQFAHLVRTSGGVVTLEWENVPLSLVYRLESLGCTVRPSARVLEIAQDRLSEKECAASCGVPTAKYLDIMSLDQLRVAEIVSKFPAILKTRRNGYDGKGQIRVERPQDLFQAWSALKNAPCVLEEVVDFESEISIIVARKPPGITKMYEPFKNKHENGILRSTSYPAEVSAQVRRGASRAAHKIAEKIDLHGILAIEFFVTQEGAVLFNEMAPRPHNSGHVTIECSYVSQFEQHIRAICNLPFKTTRCHTPGVMTNILGDEVGEWNSLILPRRTKVHVYGKDAPKAGRKMGHYTYFKVPTD